MAQSFKEKVLSEVRKIKEGKVMSYAQIAARAGNAKAARAVGGFMKNNYDKTVPCHRVVRSDGSIGDYNRGGKEAKIKILTVEGVKFITKDRVSTE